MAHRIAVFGLGYVGTVSAACFASRGNDVVGVDVNPDKVNMVNAGRSPVVEERIGELIKEQLGAGRLRATSDVRDAVASTDLALICVGTPSSRGGGLSTEYVERVADEIGAALAASDRSPYTVVVRSTVLPGTCQRLVIPALERSSGLRAGTDFGVCVNPEFLREGSSVRDFFDPPKTIVGELDSSSGALVAALYEGLPGPVFRVSLPVAEMTKYVDNSFHALKVGFANEIGAVCKASDLDSHEVMRIFMADTKLNISSAYLKPGFAFGGSCLPKDLRAFIHRSRHLDLHLPILEGVLPSNDEQIQRAMNMIIATGARRIGLFGLGFKAGTDDLRESPMVELAERLVGRGFDLLIHDSQVALSQLLGANRAYVESRIPHLSRLMAPSPDSVAVHGEVCVLGTQDPNAMAAIERANSPVVIDLARPEGVARLAERNGYVGMSW
jgi:GDP-mannose 6-dehydrogenase